MSGPIIEGNPSPMELAFLTACLVTLTKHYPGYRWGCETRGGMLFVRNKDLLGPYAYEIRLDFFDEKRLIMAGGEMLERHNMPRAKIDPERIEDAPTDAKGYMVPDLS